MLPEQTSPGRASGGTGGWKPTWRRRGLVVAPQTFPAPALIERAGASTRKKFFEFFTVPIRNANTRAAYYRAIQQFLAWTERAGDQHLEDIEPIQVAAYIERPE